MKLSDLKSLYDAGMALIYLHPNEKRPLQDGWTKRPKKTWEELKADFDPRYNIGVVLGAPSKMAAGGYLACIDVDVKDERFKDTAYAKLKELLSTVTSASTLDCPTVASGSGSGSCHLYCVSDEPFKMVEIEKHKGQWEIAIYSLGRQMVLPPSRHPNGKPYVWVHPLRAKLPVLNLENLQRYKRDASAGRDPEKASESTTRFTPEDVDLWASGLPIHFIRMVEDGTGCDDRSAALMSIAMAMCRRGFTDNQILSVLTKPGYFLAECGYDHTGSRDRSRAAHWVQKYTLEKARYETSVMRYFDNRPASLPPLTAVEQSEVRQGVSAEAAAAYPNLQKDGKPQPTLLNTLHFLNHRSGEGGPIVGFNEFNGRAYFLRDTPYGGLKGKEVADHHDRALRAYIAAHHRFEPSTGTCFEAHDIVAREHRWHPVRDYLGGLTWDGQPRLRSWLKRAFRASGPEEYLAAVGRKVLVGAVKRIMEPGCKFDYIMVLEGKQGIRKSMSLGILASQAWFTDNLGDIHNKDVVDQMTGKWIVEISELASIRGRENEHVKSFLTREVDRVRMSYGRRSEDYPRQSIFIGTTNHEEYLSDDENRRYWPVKVMQGDTGWLKANRDQLWAEALEMYNQGENVYLTTEMECEARKEQEKRYESDEWEYEIKNVTRDDEIGARHRGTDLWRAIHDVASVKAPAPRGDLNRIGKIMRRLGYERKTTRDKGILAKMWVKI